MDFDLSKLTSDQSKASETKAKPRFGPAARAVSAASGEVYASCVCDQHSQQLCPGSETKAESKAR
jgi:hypothetical protein